jgi:hypothetical protein
MSDEQTAASSATAPRRSTGSLKAGTGDLNAAAAAAATIEHAAPHATPAPRDLSMRIAETVIFLLAVIGAVAIGLGISNYLGKHPYVYAYLIAYAAFRIADLLVREEWMLGADPAHFARRIMGELPVIVLHRRRAELAGWSRYPDRIARALARARRTHPARLLLVR